MSHLRAIGVPAVMGVVFIVTSIVAMQTGQQLPWYAWLMLLGTPLMCVGYIVSHYRRLYNERQWWARRYRFTVGGVAYHFDSGARVYTVAEVEADQERFRQRWTAYYRHIDKPSRIVQIERNGTIAGVRCLIRAPRDWVTKEGRLVAGLCRGNTIEIGAGGRALANTAHVHELSHVHVHRLDGYVEEATAHELFKTVGV